MDSLCNVTAKIWVAGYLSFVSFNTSFLKYNNNNIVFIILRHYNFVRKNLLWKHVANIVPVIIGHVFNTLFILLRTKHDLLRPPVRLPLITNVYGVQ